MFPSNVGGCHHPMCNSMNCLISSSFTDTRLGGEQHLHAVQPPLLLELEGHVRAEAGRAEAASLQVRSEVSILLSVDYYENSPSENAERRSATDVRARGVNSPCEGSSLPSECARAATST